MNKFSCSICEKTHPIYWSVLAQDISTVLNIPIDEIKSRVIPIEEFFFLVDKKAILVNANLNIKVKNSIKSMHWLTWIRLSLDDFYNIAEKSQEEVAGTLLGDLFHYNNTEEVKVQIKFDLSSGIKYPDVISISANEELVQDFYTGIPLEKVNKWMQRLHHYNGAVKDTSPTP